MNSAFLNPPFIISILIAISIHEAAHAFMARKLGDPTAEYAGRLTLNPLSHLDLVGTLMFLIVGFGWAKPVPVDPRYFSHPKRDNALVALAGPASNLIVASIVFAILAILDPQVVGVSATGLLTLDGTQSAAITLLVQVCASSLFLNLALMAFNLLPIAPLDGSKILHMFIPARYDYEYEKFMQRGPMILLILILGGMFLNFPLLSSWVIGIVNVVLMGMGMVAQIFF